MPAFCDCRRIVKGIKMPPIHVMLKPASGLCNMSCKYCFYADEMKKREQSSYGIMTLNTLENVIRETLAFAQGECTFAYQGGEPTLAGLEFFRKSIEFQKKYNVNQVTIQNALQTNGYALKEEWCSFFGQNQFLIGISIDGIKATHDCYRKGASGEDTYFQVLNAVKMLKMHNVEFNVLTVVNAKTAPKIRKIYEQYKKLGLSFQQYISCLDPIGEPPGSFTYSLTPKVYGQFLIDLFELWDIDLQQGRQPFIRQFENWIGILMGVMPEACEQRGFCNIQNIVEADGSVYPCDFYVLDSYRLGNLNVNSFSEIYEERERSKFLENSKNHDQECLQCKYFILCRGGCRRHREGMERSEGGNRNAFCEGYKSFFDQYYDRMVEIAKNCLERQVFS